jgi:type VI secretion system secreted protein VgrG
MEEEGIFYYFLYDPSAGQYQHTMYLADNEAGYFDGSTYEITFAQDIHHQGLTTIDLQHMQYTDSWVTHDYNYKAPSSLTPIKTGTRFDYSVPDTKFYEWPGKYDVMDHGQRDSRFGMQLAESASVIMSGVGTYMCFMPGARFDIVDKRLEPGQRRIAVRSIDHECHNPFNADEGEFYYKQAFTAVPSTEPFHPPRTTPKAVVHGPQTAVVVDQVDPEGYGRIKVQFHWDTAGTETCWLRLAQQWAGDQIGAQWIPRVGWEVLVIFLEGDPDRPVVVGGLYNADNMYPFAVPQNLSQSGWRTRTYPQGEITAEFIFDDKDGAEEVYLFAGRNYRREIVKDELSDIGEYRRTKVGKDQSLDIGASSTTTIADDDSLKVGKDQTIEIDGKSDVTIGDDSSLKIGGDQSIEVDGDSDVTVQGDCSVEVDGDFDVSFKSDADADVSKDLTVKVDGEVSLKGSKTVELIAKSDVTIQSDSNITLQVGGTKVEITPDGVTISGDEITIKGANVTITGSMVKIN